MNRDTSSTHADTTSTHAVGQTNGDGAAHNGSMATIDAEKPINGNGLFHSSNGLEPSPSHEGGVTGVLRRAFDVVLAAGLLLLLAPVFAAIALAIKADSRGPVLFRQRRVGHGLRPFTFYKFRTMKPGADPEPHREYIRELIAGAPSSHNGLYKLAVDDRVTGVGRVLRRLSLDELPQLWNVIRGDMALVGPRPVIPYEVELYPEWYVRRFAVKPGMTGLWQVSGRNERTYEEMVRLDIEFASRRSFRRDLGILLRTPWVVIRSRGAA